MNDWKEYQIGQLYDVSSGLSKSKESFGHGETFISFRDVFRNWFLPTNPQGLVNSNEKDQLTCSVKKGDILITRTSETSEDVGMSSVALCDYPKSTFNGFCKRLRPKETAPIKVSPLFIGYLLRSRYFRKTVAQYATMTTRASLNGDSIRRIKLLFPSYEEQQAIAAILRSLDEKIELLRVQNKTLETIAQTIYKERFGRYKIGDELPEGWRVGKLGEEFDITIGRTPPRKEKNWFSNTPIGKKWISIKDIGKSGTYISNTSEFLTDEAIEKFNIPIIPTNTTILSFKMTVGRLAITTEDMLSNEAIAHLKLKLNTSLISEFIYLFLQNFNFTSMGSTSSIVTAVNSTMIKNLDFIIPNDKALDEFKETILVFFNKIKNNSNQIQILRQNRDTLLPKLMNGTLQVNEFKENQA